MLQELTYTWLHVPSGKRGTRTITADKQLLLDTLNRWNQSNPGVWVYWY